MTLYDYVKKILVDSGCDEYTYGGEWATHIMDDLKEAFPSGMEYPYIDVANEILSMSKPRPIKKAKYAMIYNTPDFIDSFSCDNLEEAKSKMFDVYVDWMVEEQCRWGSDEPTEDEKEDWDYMIYNCECWIEEYNPMTDEYEICSEPTDVELEEIGWKLFCEE